MSKIKDLIQTFEKINDWKEVVRVNFERKSGTYSYVTVTDIEVSFDKKVFHYPTKIVFEYGYVKGERSIVKNEKVTINKKKIKIIERKKIIPLSFYERRQKYSGEIFQIIEDIIGNKNFSENKFSPELLTTGDNPLYAIDSKQKWASYLLVLSRASENENTTSQEDLSFLNDLLADYGIHYKYESTLQDYVFVIFPMPYIKVVENKIKKEDGNESIFLVLEYNEIGFFYTSQLKIEIDALIKDTKKEIIYQKVVPIKIAKAKYQIVEIVPDTKAEIGYTAISVKINGTLVDKFSGYYIRDIKFDIKVK